MNILFLGYAASPVLDTLRLTDTVTQADTRLTPDDVQGFDFLVSYGYRHILKPNILDLFPSRAVNLHIAYLPWQRGADPNFWSWIENTPKGVTIHHIDAGVDTGDIIAQKEVVFDVNAETLRSSYDRLQREMISLFAEHWPAIRTSKSPRSPQPTAFCYHRSQDKEELAHLLTEGWNTPVKRLHDYGKASGYHLW